MIKKNLYEPLQIFSSSAIASIESTSETSENREAFFNGSSYLRLLTPMPMWKHSAFGIRSCRGNYISLSLS